MILNDNEIIQEFNSEESPGLIIPFEETLVRDGKVSYGLGSYGYDIRLSDKEFLISEYHPDTEIDPKKSQKKIFKSISPVKNDKESYFILPPYTYGLGTALEFIKMPNNLTGICINGKSTYARSGVIVHMTPIEAGWHGYLTIAISNTSALPCRIYANEGIAQILFLRGEYCSKNYGNRKYQNQGQEVVLSKV